MIRKGVQQEPIKMEPFVVRFFQILIIYVELWCIMLYLVICPAVESEGRTCSIKSSVCPYPCVSTLQCISEKCRLTLWKWLITLNNN